MTIALYLRISSEDVDVDSMSRSESESVSNQRSILRDYIDTHSEFSGYETVEFCDDGWSGKNFERPGFTAMMEQVKSGQIQCILVKDLSRLGRDYLVVGNYISRVFPFLGVRFIAVNDDFDSSRPQDIDSLDTSFRTLINDLYSRDLSVKVKNASRQRAERGLFLGPYAPYGYKKDTANRNHLLADEEAAQTVREVFSMYAGGATLTAIAACLNRNKILTPMLHKRQEECSRERWMSVNEDNFWTQTLVAKILRDEVYIGKTIYGRRERDRVGLPHTEKKERADWIVVEGTHEALVSQEQFEQVQRRMNQSGRAFRPASGKNLLRRKVRCGICSHAMPLQHTTHPDYCCKTPKLEIGYDCSAVRIQQDTLHEMILTLIHTYASICVDLDKLRNMQKESRRVNDKQRLIELSKLQNRKARLEKSVQGLYEKLVDGRIDKGQYLSEKNSLNREINEVTDRMQAYGNPGQVNEGVCEKVLEVYGKYTELDSLTSEVVQETVKRITVYPNDRVEIELVLQDELNIILKQEKARECAS